MMKSIVATVCAGLICTMFILLPVSGCTQKLKQENAKLTAQVNDLTGQVQKCQAEKTQIQAQIGQLQQQVSTLTAEKADLQKKLEGLTKKPAAKAKKK